MDNYNRKLYLIKCEDYDDKMVVAEDMEEALNKYREYIRKNLPFNCSVTYIFKKITSCEYIRDYEETDIII